MSCAIPEPSASPLSPPSPFVKWVGGKRSLLRELTALLPAEFGTYYEPFVGGGALFFALSPTLGKARLSDTNIDLLVTYSVIRREPEALIKRMEEHFANHSPEYY